MTRFVSLLRAVNLGPRNKVPMSTLRELYADLGHTDVVTYIQSGNVVSTGPGTTAKAARDIEAAIKQALGLDITVLVRTKAELAKTVKANPFLKAGADPAHLHVTFLAKAPKAATVKQLQQIDIAPEEFAVVGRDVFLHLPNGMGRAKLPGVASEKKLGVTGTARNWRTVTKLLDLANGRLERDHAGQPGQLEHAPSS